MALTLKRNQKRGQLNDQQHEPLHAIKDYQLQE